MAWSCLGTRSGRANFLVGVGEFFDFLMEFFGCILVGNCVWVILGVPCGLKEEFYGEIKCGILGFWIEKQAWKLSLIHI